MNYGRPGGFAYEYQSSDVWPSCTWSDSWLLIVPHHVCMCCVSCVVFRVCHGDAHVAMQGSDSTRSQKRDRREKTTVQQLKERREKWEVLLQNKEKQPRRCARSSEASSQPEMITFISGCAGRRFQKGSNARYEDGADIQRIFGKRCEEAGGDRTFTKLQFVGGLGRHAPSGKIMDDYLLHPCKRCAPRSLESSF